MKSIRWLSLISTTISFRFLAFHRPYLASFCEVYSTARITPRAYIPPFAFLSYTLASNFAILSARDVLNRYFMFLAYTPLQKFRKRLIRALRISPRQLLLAISRYYSISLLFLSYVLLPFLLLTLYNDEKTKGSNRNKSGNEFEIVGADGTAVHVSERL